MKSVRNTIEEHSRQLTMLGEVDAVAPGPQIGVRETRRVKGMYVLTEEDAKQGRKFDDVIAWRSGFLDIGFVWFEKRKIA